jgi:hypothetical protein
VNNLRIALCGIVCVSSGAWASSPYDWRFADPNSNLIAGSAISPTTSDPIGSLLFFGLTPAGRVPSSFQASLSKTTSVTYSLVTSKDDIAVLTGTFDFAALRSAGGTLGLVSQMYDGIEVLAPTTTSGRVQIALVSTTTIVLAGQTVLHAALDRYLNAPGGSASNSLIQQVPAFAGGWDMFAMSSNFSVTQALAFLYPKGNTFLGKNPALSSSFAVSTSFQLRARLSPLSIDLTVTEPDSTTAGTAATALGALPGGIKAAGPGVAGLISALGLNTNVQASGNQVELTINMPVYTLTTAVSPTGAGTIAPVTSGVPFALNVQVNLIATPAACYGTATWSPNAPGGIVTMTSNQTVTATFSPQGVAAPATTVTVTQGPFRKNNSTGRYQQSITLNNSGSSVSNVSLIFDKLTSGVTLYSPDGTTVCSPAGSPYRNIATLAPAVTTLVVEFSVSNPSLAIQYVPRVLAGTGSR